MHSDLLQRLRRLPTEPELRRQATRCLEAEPDSACLLGEDWDVIYVNPAWDRFAEENEGHCTSGHILGQSYHSFSSDRATRELLHSIQIRVNAGEAFTLFTRCDSPGIERRLASHFLPVTGGGFRGTAVLHLTIEPRVFEQRLAWGAQDAAVQERLSCSSCHRVFRGGRPGWHLDVSSNTAARAGISSSYCPTCEGLLKWTGPLIATGHQ